MCSAKVDPVCGSDDMTYINECWLQHAKCFRRDITVKWRKTTCEGIILCKQIQFQGFYLSSIVKFHIWRRQFILSNTKVHFTLPKIRVIMSSLLRKYHFDPYFPWQKLSKASPDALDSVHNINFCILTPHSLQLELLTAQYGGVVLDHVCGLRGLQKRPPIVTSVHTHIFLFSRKIPRLFFDTLLHWVS